MGIGLEFAHIFARNGHDLFLVARSADKLKNLSEELSAKYSVKAHYLPVDLSVEHGVETVFDEISKLGLTVDILVNNAGFGKFGLFAENDWAKEQQMISLNMGALTHLTKLFLPGMLARKHGKILNVGSIASFFPGPTMAVYYATKAYMLSFSEALSSELAGTGVFVTCLCPGPTASNFQAAANQQESKVVKGKKLPTAKEVAEFGYKELMKGTVVAIHGFLNKLIVFSQRLTPRFLVRKMIRFAQEK